MAALGTAKERMLKTIRKALIEKRENPYPELDITPLYVDCGRENEIMFAEEFTRVQGQFIYCQDKLSLIESLVELTDKLQLKQIIVLEDPVKSLLDEFEFPYQAGSAGILHADAGITLCEALVARSGSVLISTGLASGRRLSAFPPIHIVIAHATQLVTDIKDALTQLRKKYLNSLPSSISLITGPSRTADIEKTLVLGAHGPKELYVLFLDSDELL